MRIENRSRERKNTYMYLMEKEDTTSQCIFGNDVLGRKADGLRGERPRDVH